MLKIELKKELEPADPNEDLKEDDPDESLGNWYELRV